MMAGLVLGAVIYPIGRVLVTTLDGFCIVIGLEVIGRRTESCRDSRAKTERFHPFSDGVDCDGKTSRSTLI